ncbi:hypothetical protein [Jatrophihabitans sp.]|uniref:hypothetical protein n=1 Tax=Jatrophihabitans sp. TaxID=1932789 RepID=UPI0030C7206B|nr:hypothetical protein [Jatrophihabitans sp.]
MADNYDLPIPTINGTTISVDWLRNDPRRIYRLLRTLVMQNLIGWKLLTGRVDLTGTGFGIYEVTESIFSALQGSVVRPLSQYPLTQVGVPTLATVKPDKTGLKDIISDEDAAHNRIDKVVRDLKKIANQLTFQNDALALAAIASSVTKTVAAVDHLSNPATAFPWLDVELAAASILEENQGYNADSVATTPTLFARAIASAIKAGQLPREANAAITKDVNSIQIGAFTWYKSTNMPAGVDGVVLDSSMLGSMAYENLGGGYQGDPSDMASGVESKRWREEGIDGVVIQARIVRAPMVQEPNSARVITGWS